MTDPEAPGKIHTDGKFSRHVLACLTWVHHLSASVVVSSHSSFCRERSMCCERSTSVHRTVQLWSKVISGRDWWTSRVQLVSPRPFDLSVPEAKSTMTFQIAVIPTAASTMAGYCSHRWQLTWLPQLEWRWKRASGQVGGGMSSSRTSESLRKSLEKVGRSSGLCKQRDAFLLRYSSFRSKAISEQFKARKHWVR